MGKGTDVGVADTIGGVGVGAGVGRSLSSAGVGGTDFPDKNPLRRLALCPPLVEMADGVGEGRVGRGTPFSETTVSSMLLIALIFLSADSFCCKYLASASSLTCHSKRQ